MSDERKATSVDSESDAPSLRLKDRKDIGENFSIHAIPVENYLGHFAIDPHMPGPSLTAEAISREVGTNAKWVSREIMRFQLQPDFADVMYTSGKQEVYRPFVTELIREQYIWQQHYHDLPSHLNMNRISDEVGRSRAWIQHQIDSMGPIGGVFRKGKNKQIKMYPRVVVKKLREINLATPLDNGGVSLTALSELIGRDDGWIQRRMRDAGIEPEMRRSAITGLINIYYPQTALDLIAVLREESYPPAGDWLTVGRMSKMLGKSPLWIENRITEEMRECSEVRLDDALKPSTHYPPDFFEELMVLRGVFDQIPEAGDWVTVKYLARETGQDHEWIKRRLAESNLYAEWRRVPAAVREYRHYAPESLDVIRQAIMAREPEADGWLTLYAIGGLIPKSEKWIKRRLDRYRDQAELRKDSQGVARIHYSPEVVIALQAELDELFENPQAGEWVTISTLEKKLGMHAVTISRIMEQIEVESETRLDLKGRPKQHFSPATQMRLAEKAMELYGYPDADGWLSFSRVMAYVARSESWIRSELERRSIVPEKRLDRSRHPVDHYDPELIHEVKVFGDSLEAGDMVSVKDITRILQRSLLWVKPRLEALGAQPEKRFSQSGHLTDHFPRHIIDDLSTLS